MIIFLGNERLQKPKQENDLFSLRHKIQLHLFVISSK